MHTMKRMSEVEYREKLEALGMTTDAAQFLNIAERTSRRYALLALIAIKVHAYAARACESGGAAFVNNVHW
jgi:hypothetical protein